MKAFRTGAVLLLLSALYSAVLFLVKTGWDASAWILYGFTILMVLLSALMLSGGASSGAPLILSAAARPFAVALLLAQWLVGGILLECLSGLPVVPVLAGEVILLAAWLAIAFAFSGLQAESGAQASADRRAVVFLRRLEGDIAALADQAEEDTIKKELLKLAEEVRYSSPSPSAQLGAIERELDQAVEKLRLDLDDPEGAPKARIETIHWLLAERERIATVEK